MKKIIMIITLLFICCCNISRAERVALNDYMDKTQFIQTYNQNMNKLKYPFKLDYIHPLNSNNYAYIITCYPYKEHEKFYTIHTNRAGNIMFISISPKNDFEVDELARLFESRAYAKLFIYDKNGAVEDINHALKISHKEVNLSRFKEALSTLS